MDTASFEAIVALTAAAAKLPKARRAAVFAKLALTPEQKRAALREFMWRTWRWSQKKDDEPIDQLAWIFAGAAMGPREVLPWKRPDVAFMLRCTIPRPASLPPAIVVRAVQHLAKHGPLPAQIRGWTARAATAIESSLPSDAATRRAVARLRDLASVKPRGTKAR